MVMALRNIKAFVSVYVVNSDAYCKTSSQSSPVQRPKPSAQTECKHLEKTQIYLDEKGAMLLTEFVRAGINAWLMASAVGIFFFFFPHSQGYRQTSLVLLSSIHLLTFFTFKESLLHNEHYSTRISMAQNCLFSLICFLSVTDMIYYLCRTTKT